MTADPASILSALPPELAERIRAFQSAEGIGSEAEAIRCLIGRGLQAWGESRPAAAAPRSPRSVGPEDEARGGHEAPGMPGPTVPGTEQGR